MKWLTTVLVVPKDFSIQTNMQTMCDEGWEPYQVVPETDKWTVFFKKPNP